MEVFICTLTPGLLDKTLSQKLAPARGQEKGEKQNKNNLKERSAFTLSRLRSRQVKQNKFNSINNQFTRINPIWVGGLVALGLLSASFFNMPKAHAADANWSNVDVAKKVIEQVAPIVSEKNQPDVTAASIALESDNFIQKPLVVETAVTPPVRTLRSYQTDVAAQVGPHAFPYGYCTYYVSRKREVTWSGNAGTWLTGAKVAGLTTGSTPQPGAIMVTSEGGYAGHVAYVESVNGSQITISEMNYKGYGVTSSRTISADTRVIKGYIY